MVVRLGMLNRDALESESVFCMEKLLFAKLC